MRKEFKKLPIKTPEDILDSVFDEKIQAKNIYLENVLSKPLLPSKQLKQQLEADNLTDKLYYKDLSGKIISPVKGFSFKKPAPHIGYLGDQTSYEHKENIKQQSALTVSRMDEKSQGFPDKSKRLLMALYANSGKKYLSQTNLDYKSETDDLFLTNGSPSGQIEFPDYEKLSAYIAARRFRDMGMQKEEAKPYVVAIFNQNKFTNEVEQPQISSGVSQFDKEKENFIELYGDDTFKMTLDLTESIKGVPSYKDLSNLSPEIERGEKIILKELDPYVIDISSRAPVTVKEIDEKFYANSQLDEFEDDAKRTLENLERQKEEERIREKHRREYEEIIKGEEVLVKEQRELENKLIGEATNLSAVLAAATIKAREYNQGLSEKKKKKSIETLDGEENLLKKQMQDDLDIDLDV